MQVFKKVVEAKLRTTTALQGELATLKKATVKRGSGGEQSQVQATEQGDDVSSDEENMTDPLTEEELEKMRHFYPDDEALALAQRMDPEWNSKREQLQLLLNEPKHLLNEAYMKKLGISDRRLKELAHLHMQDDVLCHIPLPRQFYQAAGRWNCCSRH